MNIDFGMVKKYFPDKGFGFVTRTFRSGYQSEIFFHIKNVKRIRSNLTEKINNGESIDTICFWYETENTNKGEQVYSVLSSEAIHNMRAGGSLTSFVEKIESIWNDVDSKLPIWLYDVTFDLVGSARVNELILERAELEIEKKEREEAQRKIEEEKLQKLIKDKRIQEEIKKNEFEELVKEIKDFGPKQSKDVSSYIMRNRLGNKYKNISGIVKMEMDGTSWNFKGGFPPDIYAKLCSELSLSNQGSRARVVEFTPFKDL